MRRILLAPVLDQDLLGAGHLVGVGVDLQAREAPADHAAVGGGTRGGGTRVGEYARRAPARRRLCAAELVVVCVEDVDIRVGGEVRVEGQPEQTPVPEVVDVGA